MGVGQAAALLVLLLPTPVQAKAETACQTATAPGRNSTAIPYEDQLYDPARLAPLATGRGIRVAVIDSGVDAEQPQLVGKVAAGRDFLRGNPDGRQDCLGHGTAVASIIAAAPAAGIGLRGLAPGVTIVPIRISEEESVAGTKTGEHSSPQDFADAIDYAAGAGHAQVINLSLTTDDVQPVRDAVARAIAHGVVVVAAAGNNDTPDSGNPTPYPADYPDVIGVGAIDANGVQASFSRHGSYVDVMAAGKEVTADALHKGQTSVSGTSFATPFVAATAALILQRFPGLTPQQVSHRIVATADPAPGGRHSDEYGFGLLNPYRALTETLAPQTTAAPAPAAAVTQDPATLALNARRAHSQNLALLVAAIGAAAVLLGIILTGVIRRGRRRGWHPAA
jgi:type VII secretion-associated serine protease mycosin